jgi:hypothetical protein
MQKIAILGGGIGALAIAAELTNDPNRQKNSDITIYQMGWRLGARRQRAQPRYLRSHSGLSPKEINQRRCSRRRPYC